MTTAETTSETTSAKVLPRLKQRYRDEIAGELREQFSYGNVMQIPGVTKVVVNMGVGDAARDAKLIDGAVRDLATITGQKPQIRRATKSSRSSSCARACRSARRSPCATTGCGSSWTGC
jgi:hypothetical protein